ncbi:MAG: V-type ATPase subunit [Armatimonadota bacterium]|nr:V-type ATPase subunit [Armatimonadota bacterium]
MPDFPYINARVRAMRSRLLSAAQLEELLATPSLAAFQHALAATPYGDDLQQAQTRYQGVRAVDEALARNLQRTTRKILEFADGLPQVLITVLLLRWDLANLRAVARGKHAGRSPDDIAEALMPAGTLGEAVLREMVASPDMSGIVGTLEALNHPFTAAMAEALAAYGEARDLAALELRLDRAYAEVGLGRTAGLGADARVLRWVLQTEIDVTNIKTALRLAAVGNLDEERRLALFIPGGSVLSPELFLELSALATQARTWRVVRAAGFPIGDTPTDLVAFERRIDLALTRAMVRRYTHGDPLGLDIVMGYLTMKSVEVANIRLIARAKLLNLPRERARAEMVLV